MVKLPEKLCWQCGAEEPTEEILLEEIGWCRPCCTECMVVIFPREADEYRARRVADLRALLVEL